MSRATIRFAPTVGLATLALEWRTSDMPPEGTTLTAGQTVNLRLAEELVTFTVAYGYTVEFPVSPIGERLVRFPLAMGQIVSASTAGGVTVGLLGTAPGEISAVRWQDGTPVASDAVDVSGSASEFFKAAFLTNTANALGRLQDAAAADFDLSLDLSAVSGDVSAFTIGGSLTRNPETAIPLKGVAFHTFTARVDAAGVLTLVISETNPAIVVLAATLSAANFPTMFANAPAASDAPSAATDVATLFAGVVEGDAPPDVSGAFTASDRDPIVQIAVYGFEGYELWDTDGVPLVGATLPQVDADVEIVGVTSTGATISISGSKLIAGVPAQVTDLDVIGCDSNGQQMAVYVGNAPADRGAAITDYEYQIDGGSWVSLGTATLPLAVLVSGLAYETEISVKVRAVNSIGGGAESAAFVITPNDTGGTTAVTIPPTLAVKNLYAAETAIIESGDVRGVTRVSPNSGFPGVTIENLAVPASTQIDISVTGIVSTGMDSGDQLRIFTGPSGGDYFGTWVGAVNPFGGDIAGNAIGSSRSWTYTTGAGETAIAVSFNLRNVEVGDVFKGTVSVSYGEPGAALSEPPARPAPPSPTAPAVMSPPTLGSVSDEVTWTLASAPANGGSAITSYDLRWSANDGSTWTEVIGAASTGTIAGTDTTATTYLVQGRAVNAIGAGAWSVAASIGGAAGPTTLVAPTVAYPAWPVSGGATVTVADGRAALQDAIAGGGTIVLEAGTYDLTGWVTQPIDEDVKIVGQGRGDTILLGGFDPTTHFSTGPTAVFGVVGDAQISVEGLTMRGWRAGLMSSGYYPTSQFPDGAILTAVRTLTSTPLVWDKGLAMRDVLFDQCGRAVHLEEHISDLFTNRFNNVHVHHVDVTRSWLGFCLVSTGGGSNWMFYDCRFHDNCIPNAGSVTWGNVSPGIIGARNHDTPGQGAPGQNIFIEHCTFSALGNLSTYLNSNLAGPRFAPIRLTGQKNVRVRRCRFEDIGYAPDGVTVQNTLPSEFESLGYLKCDDVLFEDVILENTCAGGEAAHGAKGSISNDPGTSTYHIKNLYWRKHRPVPAAHVAAVNPNQVRLIDGNWYTRGLFGTSHINEAVWDNVWIEDIHTLFGAIPRVYDYGFMGDNVFKNLTLKDVRGFDNQYNRDAPLQLATNFTGDPSITIDNVLIEDFVPKSANPSAIDLWRFTSANGDLSALTITDVSFGLATPVDSATILYAEVPVTSLATPTGEVVGTAPTKFSKRGPNAGGNTALAAYGGTVTGASLDWMTANVIGCAER